MFDLKMSRRSFLTGATKAAIVVAAAPAIVKAENLMKIWVPPEKTIVMSADANTYNFTVSGLVPGTRVALFDEITGETYFNQIVREGGTFRTNVPVRNGSPVILRSRRPGYKAFQVRTGLPYDGGKNKVAVSMQPDVVWKT